MKAVRFVDIGLVGERLALLTFLEAHRGRITAEVAAEESTQGTASDDESPPVTIEVEALGAGGARPASRDFGKPRPEPLAAADRRSTDGLA